VGLSRSFEHSKQGEREHWTDIFKKKKKKKKLLCKKFGRAAGAAQGEGRWCVELGRKKKRNLKVEKTEVLLWEISAISAIVDRFVLRYLRLTVKELARAGDKIERSCPLCPGTATCRMRSAICT
jgi:hypothetical protein